VRIVLRAALLVLATVPAGIAHGQSAAPAAPSPADWTTRVERTAEAGYRMGNPDAPLKLVEYGSLACSHCASFEAVAGDAIREQVRSGRLSFEYRPHPIFPSDPGMFLLLGCQSPELFFPTVQRLYADQANWIAKLDAQDARLRAEMERSFPAAIPSFVSVAGTDRLFRENGLSDQQIAACLADQAALAQMGEAGRRAVALGVEGTPTLFLNGRKLELSSFEELVGMLRQN
jgi:protein-disulfide isomerase